MQINSQKYHSSGCIGHGKLIQLFERLKFGTMQQVLVSGSQQLKES